MTARKSTGTAGAADRKYDGFTAEERDAMKESAKELKARRGAKVDEESAVLENAELVKKAVS
jgi:hypothetical protein